MLRFDDEKAFEDLRIFLQKLAPTEAWCNTELMSHGTDFFCPYCSLYSEGKEYQDIDWFHFDFECRYCGTELVGVEFEHNASCPFARRT